MIPCEKWYSFVNQGQLVKVSAVEATGGLGGDDPFTVKKSSVDEPSKGEQMACK